MLQIDIVGFSGENLILEVDTHPNNGRSSATKSEQVDWKVNQNISVDSISAITWKEMPGSEDVFSRSRPAELGSNLKHWRGIVNDDAEDFSVYIYSITWVKKVGNIRTTHIFDPIISIKPSTSPLVPIGIVAGVLGLSSLLYWRMERMNLIKKNRRLKDENDKLTLNIGK